MQIHPKGRAAGALLLTILVVSIVSQTSSSQQGVTALTKNKTEMSDKPLRSALPMAFVPTIKADEAKKFYSDTLGLEFVSEDKYAITYRVNGTLSFRLQRVRELTPQPFTVCGWEVSDVEKTVAELVKNGVKFEIFGFTNQDKTGVCTFENGDKVAWFRDPDGNTLSIAELVH